VCPSNGPQAPPTMLDNAPEESMVNRPIVSLSRSRSLQSDSFSFSLSLPECMPGVLVFLSSSMVSDIALAHMQLPEKCRHPHSCASPSLTRSLSFSMSLRSFSLIYLRLFFSSWPTDQQTAAHALVVDTILEHWLSARSTRRSRDVAIIRQKRNEAPPIIGFCGLRWKMYKHIISMCIHNTYLRI